MSETKDFWDIYERGELYAVKGEPVQLMGYHETYGEAIFLDGSGNRVVAYPGQIRSIRTLC